MALNPDVVKTLASACAYLDRCDDASLIASPVYYKACAELVRTFYQAEPNSALAMGLSEASHAAREIQESLKLEKQLPYKVIYFTELNAFLNRISAP